MFEKIGDEEIHLFYVADFSGDDVEYDTFYRNNQKIDGKMTGNSFNEIELPVTPDTTTYIIPSNVISSVCIEFTNADENLGREVQIYYVRIGDVSILDSVVHEESKEQ